MNTKSIGNVGEKYALTYLLSKDYKILKTNWFCNHGEIDIIAYKNKALVFVEVKYRKSFNFGLVEEAFDYKKQRHLKRSIGIFLSRYKLKNVNYRVDLLCIQNSQIKYYENALV